MGLNNKLKILRIRIFSYTEPVTEEQKILLERRNDYNESKKILALILAVAAAMGTMTGCGSDSESGQGSGTAETNQTDTQDDAEENVDTAGGSDTSAASGNVLVVYYSATGNTAAVAETIADTTGGDLFELEPAEPYTDADLDWTDDNSRVSQEYADESLRDVELVSATVDNWDSYDTVFIGYPKIQYGFLSV